MVTLGLMLAVLFGGFLVLRASNAVHSVLSLVLVFAFTALLFLQMGAEFFALLLFTVYIGAIAILFLFVIMMLDLRLAELHGSAYYHVPLGASVGLAFVLALTSVLGPELGTLAGAPTTVDHWLLTPHSNLKILGQVLYNYYQPFVFLITLILLLAMVAVITLTLHPRSTSSVAPSTDRRSLGNIYGLNVEQCYKNPSLGPGWEPLYPSLAFRQRQSVTSGRKWPETPYGGSSDETSR